VRSAFAALALAACGASPTPSPSPPQPPPALAGRVVLISVDGMMPDTYLDPDAHGLRVPMMRHLVASGASGRVHGVMPTVTYPTHTTMVTGVPPSVHRIVANKPLDPLSKNQNGWYWYAEDIAVPTLYQAVEARGGTSALIEWPVAVGAHASFVVPEYWRAITDDDKKLQRAISTPGVLDAVEHEHPDLWRYLRPGDVEDRAQFDIARTLLATRHPDLTLVHVFQVDDAEHESGPWSPGANAALENVDTLLGQLVAQLEQSPEWPRTTLFVVSDHGFAPVLHELHLGALLVKHGLVHETADHKVDAASAAVNAAGGTALIYVLDPAKAGDVDAAIAELGDHVARRISHAELVQLGGDPAASFAIVAAPTYAFSDARTGDVVTDVSPRGTHGWPPTDPQMAASIIVYGPHVPHVTLGTVDMLDLAPTMAALLGVALPTAVGKPISVLVGAR
jgi:predicted AlkP superfamily pyrophosphatase or phosphodiesterase